MQQHEVVDGVEIIAPLQRVWDIVSDIEVMPRFSTELYEVHWANGFHEPGLGAKFLGRNRNRAIGEWTTVSQIVAFDPPRAFGWAVGDPENPAATWQFDLRPITQGTRLEYTARIGPGPSGVTMLIERSPERAQQIIEGRRAQFRAAVAATLAGIRELAEQS
jgi:hypothetical protein